MKCFLGALAVSALLCSPVAAEEPVRIFDLHMEPEISQTVLGYPAHIVSYVIENTGQQHIAALRVSVISRNSLGQIVENQDRQLISTGSLPGGLAPGEQMVERHGLVISNATQNVESFEVRVREFRVID